MKQKKGITLISLVITIVILMMLAGVAISITVDENGIFEKANNAKTGWNANVVDEENKINIALGYLGDNQPEGLPEGWDSTKISSVFTETSTIYGVEKERKVPIPVGYSASGIEGENSIIEGLVIYEGNEAVTGEENSSEHVTAMETRNQYVWIPVDNINSMVMCKNNNGTSICNLELHGNVLECATHGYSTETELTPANINTTGLAGRLYYDKNPLTWKIDFTKRNQTFVANTGYREPDILDHNDNDSYMEIAGVEGGTVDAFKEQLNIDFIEMAKSVAKYGGFYVGRYEAGASGASKKNQKVLTAASSAAESDNYIVGNMWYGLYNILRNSTSVDRITVKSHMICRKPVLPNS